MSPRAPARYSIAVAVLLACASPLAGAAGAASGLAIESIIDLGTLGGASSAAGGITSDGRVVGDAALAAGNSHAFLADGVNPMRDLGTIRTDPAASRAKAVSPDGSIIAGWAAPTLPSDHAAAHQSYHAARWRASTGYAPEEFHTLFEPAGQGGTGCNGPENPHGPGTTTFSFATGVNDAGTVVGISDYLLNSCVSSGPRRAHAFRYQGNGPMEDLGNFDDSTGGGCAHSHALGINAAGDVVGLSGRQAWGGFGSTCGFDDEMYLIAHAFLIPHGQGKGAMVDLGQPANGTGNYNYSEALATNDHGQIAVNGTANDGTLHAYRYEGGGVYTPLGALGTDTKGLAINNHGEIVGNVWEGAAPRSPFLYTGGTLVQLQQLLPADTPWALARATAINDAGEIAGTGFVGGAEHAFRIRLAALGADIVSGPPNATSSRTATFEFTSARSGVPFECSLDGAAFSACTSPQEYKGVPDGAHVFSVRIHPADRDPSIETVNGWMVDTAAPVALIDAAPSGAANGPSATIEFHKNKPNLTITFVCQLDADPALPCESPHYLSGLPAGPHTFTITATDQLGNTSRAPTVVSWTVQGQQVAPASDCAAPARASATSGLMTMVGRSGTCLVRATVGGDAVWKATGPVTVNGISVTPDGGGSVLLSAKGVTGTVSTTGPAEVQLGSLPAVLLPVVGWAQDVGGLMQPPSGVQSKLAESIGGLDVPLVWPKVELSGDNGGTAKITMTFALPEAFKAIPGSQKKISGDVQVTASNDLGTFWGGKFRLGEAWFGAFGIRNIELGYDDATRTFDGGFGILLGPKIEGMTNPEIRVAAIIGARSPLALFDWGLRKFSLTAQTINKPLGTTGLFLQSIGGEASRETGSVAGRTQNYLRIGGNASVSIGPELPFFEVPAVSFDGSMALSLSDPWMFEAAGQARILTFPLAAGKVVYTYGGGFALEGTVTATIAGYGFSAGLVQPTFIQGRELFNIEAVGDVVLLGSSHHATVIFSTKGFAACADVKGPLGNFAIGWGIRTDGTKLYFAGVCDVGPLRVAAAAAQSTPGEHVVTLGPTAGARLLAIRGRGRAPDVLVTGPGGLKVETGVGHTSVRSADALLFPDDANATTFVVLPRGTAGQYTVTAPGNDITSVETAAVLPPATPKVTTRKGPAAKRTLTYSLTPAAGRELELYEQGAGGAGRLLVRTTRAKGTLRFKPQAGIGASRKILAVIVQNGLPRSRTALAPYRVADGPPPKVRGLTRRGANLVWRAAPRAKRYAVEFFSPKLGATGVVTSKRRLRIPTGITTGTVVALDALDRAGRPATTKLPAPKPRRPKKKKN